MAGTPVESCQFVVLGSPRGHLGSVLDVRTRLHCTRGGFHRCIHISKVLCVKLVILLTLSRRIFEFASMSITLALVPVGSGGSLGFSHRTCTQDLSRRALEWGKTVEQSRPKKPKLSN